MPSKRVLHFGYDELLAEARTMILEDAGYETLAAAEPKQALRMLRSKTVNVVMVCHSVPPDDLADVLQQMKLVKPHIPLLVVHVGGLIQPQRSLADGFIDGLRGPEHLLARVAACIARVNRTAAAS
jgi:DNA-binding NtrC family response regulator